MTENLRITAECVLPVVLLIALGMLIRHVKWLDQKGIDQIDKISFNLLIPMTMFKNVYNSDFRAAFDGRLITIAVGVTLLSFGVALLLACLKEKEGARRGSLAQSIFRNNCLVLGLPILTAMYGEGELTRYALILAFVIPINNVLAVVMLFVFTSYDISFGKLIRRVVTNPYILFIGAGLLINLSGIHLPQAVAKCVSDLSAAASPIALISLGAVLRLSAVKNDMKTVVYGTVSRLLFLPLIFVPLMIVLGVRRAPLVALYFVVGTPCSVTSYVMAKKMGADGELAAHLVVLQTVFSVLSVFAVLLILSTLGYT